MQFLEMIDALEDMAEDGRRVPGTGRIMLDRDELARLIDRMRATAPAELREADEIRERGESIVNEAYVFAKKMKAKTEEDHRTAIQQSAIVGEAEEVAEEIRKNAEREADRTKQRIEGDAARLIKDSDVYAAQALERLSNHLDQVTQNIQDLHKEAMELKGAIENGLRYLGARHSAANGNGAKKRRAKTKGGTNGHANGNGNGSAGSEDAKSLNQEELVTLASGRGS